MEWFFYALIASLILAIRSDVNRRYKLDGFRLNFWRSLFISLFMLPGLVYFGIPQVTGFFYLAVIFAAGMSVIGMTIRLNLAAQHNGRVANMEGPSKTYTAFFLWLVIDPVSREHIFSEPLIFLGVLCMMTLTTFAISGIRKNDVSWKTFVMITPIGILVAVLEVMIKIILDQAQTTSELYAKTFYFLFLTFFLGAIIGGLIAFVRRDESRPMLPPNMLKAGAIIGLLVGVKLLFFYQALKLAENPGYVGAIMMLAPVWLLIFHRIRKIPDEASPFMGTIMVLSAIGLVLITQ